MRRKLLRLGTWVIVGLASLLVLVLVGVGFYTQTEQFRLLLRERALAALRDSLNGEVTLERVSGSIWTGITFHHLSVQQNGAPVLSIPQVAVTINLLPQLYSLLRSYSLHIASLELTAPMVGLVQEQEKGWNMTRLLKTSDQPQEPSTLALFIDRLKIAEGQVEARPADGEAIQVTGFSVNGSLALLPSGIQADLATLTFSLTRAGMPEVQWSGGLAYDSTKALPVLSVRSTDLRTAESHLWMAGTVEDLSAPTTTLTVEAERLAVHDLLTLLPTLPLQEDLSGSVHLTGPLSALQLATTLEAPNGRVITSVTANLTQTPPQYQGTLEVERFAVDKVLHLANFGGEVNGRLSFAWTTLETAQGELQVQASGLLVQGWQVGDINVVGNLAKAQVAVSAEARGKSGKAHLQSHVTLGTPLTYALTATVSNLDVEKATAGGSPLAGHLNLDAWVKGSGTSLAELDGAAQVTLLPSQLGSITISQGRVASTLHEGQLTLNEVRLLANDTTLTAQGKVSKLQGVPEGKITYALRAKDLAPWLTLAGLQGEGGVQLTGMASGTLTALQVEGKASLSNLRVTTSSLQSGTVTYALSEVGSARPRAHITATLNQVDAGMRLHTVTADLTLAGLQPAEVQAAIVAQDDQMRTHRLKTQAHYTPERVEVLVQEFALQLPVGTWRMAKPAQFVLQDNRLTIDELLLQRANQTVSARGVLARQGAQDLHLQVTRFPLADLRPLLGTGPEVSGQVTAEVGVQGTAVSPVIAVTLTTDTVTVAGQSYAGLTAQGAYRQERLDLNLLLRQDTTHSLTVAGGVPVYLGWAGERAPAILGEANLRVQSEGLSLAFLTLLSKEIQDVQGTLSMDVRVHGPVEALVPDGEVQVRQGRVRVRPLELTLTDIGLQMHLAPDALQVTQLGIHAGEGQLSGSGTLALQRYTITALNLTLTADRFRVINTRQYVAAVSGQLVGSGSLPAPVMRGTLELVDTTLRPDLALLQSGPAAPDPTVVVVHDEQELTTLAQPEKPANEHDSESAAPSQPDTYRQLRLDLTVTVPRGTWVHLNDGSVELRGQIRARKNPAEEVALTGSMETVRGWYAVYNRKFRLEQGQIVFTGGSPIDPSLDLMARYTLPKYTVDVVVKGTAREPTLTLRSDPQLEQADILSLLLFGRPVNALSDGEKVSLQSQALQTTIGYVAADLRRSVAERLGVDNLEFDMGENLGQSRVGVGKYVRKDVYFSSSQKLGDKQEQEFSVEYQFEPDWQLKTSTTSRGNNGIDLFWHKKY